MLLGVWSCYPSRTLGARFDTVFGDYLVGPRLGAGSGGTADLAISLNLSLGLPSPLVLKRLSPAAQVDVRFRERFRHEAQIAVLVNSPYLAQIYAVGEVEGTLFIAMEFIPGVDASELTHQIFERAQPLSLSVAGRLMIDVLHGLEALHGVRDPRTHKGSGFVHRDLAPKNLLLTPHGRARILDLGIGKSALQGFKTQTGLPLGTPGYMAPEQVLAQPVDARTDLYVAAIVLYEWVTARPFIARGPAMAMMQAMVQPQWVPAREALPALPPQFDELLATMLSVNPQDRLPTAAAFAAALGGFVGTPTAEADVLGELLSGYEPPVCPPTPVMGPGTDNTVLFAQMPQPERIRSGGLRPLVLAIPLLGLSLGAGLYFGPAATPVPTPEDVRTAPTPAPSASPTATARAQAPSLDAGRLDASAPAHAKERRSRAPVSKAPPAPIPQPAASEDPERLGLELLAKVRALRQRLPASRQAQLRALEADIQRDRSVRSGRSSALKRLRQHARTIELLQDQPLE